MSRTYTCGKCRSVDVRLTGYYTDDGWVQLICYRCEHLQWENIGVIPKDGERISASISTVINNPLLANKRPEYPSYMPLQSLYIPEKTTTKPQQIILNRSKRQGLKESETFSLIDHIFINVIGATFPGYVDRPVQRELANKIWKARIGSNILIAEAGVGVGKSFAYLVPAMQRVAGTTPGPIVISTKTIALQEQLYNKDIPFVLEAMEATKSIFLAKGKTNYLCLNRLNDAIRIDPKNEELILLENWVKNSQVNSECAGFGDKSWIPEVSEEVWNRVCVKRCQESRCKLFSVCGYMSYRQQRRRASGIIVINHDLLIADLRIRKRNKMLWPTPGMYIIDEAHALETSAQRQLSCVIGYGKMSYVLEQVARRKETRELISLETIKKALESLDEFFKILKRNLDPSGESKIIHAIPETVEKARRMTAALKEPFEGVQIALAGYGESVKGEFIEEAAECMEEAIDALEIFCKDVDSQIYPIIILT